MSDAIKTYIKKARTVLEKNQVPGGAFTLPSGNLYPHQWNWDAGFIAIGISHYDTDQAIRELRRLFSGQWRNGMLPHIVFNPDGLGGYFPEPDFWQTELSPDAPGDVLTSGITMPPIHAYAALQIYENAGRKDRVGPFLEWIYPRLQDLHRFFYRERNPESNGLACIIHPWESGMDNSPSWDETMNHIDLDTVQLPAYQRKDTGHVDSSMRPTDRYYDFFVYLMELFKRHNYDQNAILKECPFQVYDPLFNSILCASNESLASLAAMLGDRDGEQEAREWHEQTSKAISGHLFHEEHHLFDAYDLVGRRHLEIDTVSGFMPLFGGGAKKEQVDVLYSHLNSKSFCALHQGNCFTVPSFDTQKEGFKRENYWRGPVWINMNWMLYKGLRRYGFRQKADSLAKNILELPMRSGFHEYFDSFDGRGYGSRDFSWTAALFLDVAHSNYLKTGRTGLLKRLGRVLWTRVPLNTGRVDGGKHPENVSQQMLSAIGELRDRYYRNDGTVDYEALKNSDEYARYRAVAATLRQVDPGSLGEDRQRLAFWVNLYNTIIVDGIIALGIRNSVKEVIGFFRKLSYRIGGHSFTPDDIEHGILRGNRRRPGGLLRQFGPLNSRKQYMVERPDPRIHFALVCGSRSCAPIKFYSPGRIDEQLDTAASNFINSSEVIVIPGEKRVLLSSIFNWYGEDFGGSRGALEFIERYIVDDDKREFLRQHKDEAQVDYLYYDWNLNR